MAIPRFSRDEDKDEINNGEWLRMINKNNLVFKVGLFLRGDAFRWWDSLDEGTKLSPTWENFEDFFSIKRIKDTKMEEMYKIQAELKESK
jgi:hypothetical protein